MGEIFKREAAHQPEPFTGERLTGAIGGQVQIEHYHRYLYAREFCRDLDVVDVASGEGYGSALLAQVARRVVGVDYAAAAVASAVANFGRSNLHFLQGDARALPLADASCDCLISFETIEHLGPQEAFLREIHRVLRPDGCLIISTPDRDVYSPLGAAANPFHVRELTRIEFVALLRRFFVEVATVQQRPMVGSALLGDAASAAPAVVFDRRGDRHFEACSGLPRAPYVLAIAANRTLPSLPPSLYIERSDLDTLSGQLAARQAQIAALESELALSRAAVDACQAEIQRVRMAVTAAEAEIANALAQAETARTDAATAHADAERATAAARIAMAAQAEAAAAHAEAAARAHALARQLDYLGGSLRTFLRTYLPRLRRHLRK